MATRIKLRDLSSDSFSPPRPRARPALGVNERGRTWVGILVILVSLGAFAGAGLLTFGKVILPGTLGIRQIIFGPGAGYREQAMEPGLHWNIPFYTRIHVMPSTAQVINFIKAQQAPERDFGAIDAPTLDGQVVDIDISVVTRLYSGPGTDDGIEHGGPADLVKALGFDEAAWRNTIARETQDVLKRSFRTLSSMEFYNPKRREPLLESSLHELRVQLAKYGIRAEYLLFRRYTYRSHKIDIDGAIFRKNLQEVEKVVAQRRGQFAEVQAEHERVSAEGDAKVKSLINEGDNKVIVLRSEADLYLQKKKAEGDLEVAKVSAEIDLARSTALAKTAGAELYVARRMSPLLASLRGGVVHNVDPYDIKAWMRRLGVTSPAPVNSPEVPK